MDTPAMAATHSLTIFDLERAMGFWMKKEPSPDKVSIGKSARALADVYGELVYSRQGAIQFSELSPAQQDAISKWREAAAD